MSTWQDDLRNNNVPRNVVIHRPRPIVITAAYMLACMTDMQTHNNSPTPEVTLEGSPLMEVSPKVTPEVGPRM